VLKDTYNRVCFEHIHINISTYCHTRPRLGTAVLVRLPHPKLALEVRRLWGENMCMEIEAGGLVITRVVMKQ
jgi:hypothetical protein